ncbi:MAG: hypothetical protein Q4E91_10980 [Lachnospiraceae bacterium]|nr:hypothetical protein [Lachnospiraceae bacterium]
MGKTDFAVNRLLERKTIFADLMNGTLFHGEQVLSPEQLELQSGRLGTLAPGKTGGRRAVQRQGDIRMSASMGTYRVIFANETQKKVDYSMPVRNMLYDALEYTRQVQELEKAHKMEQAVLLSGLMKKDRLQPVITTVFYLGDEWDGCKSLHGLLGIDGDDEWAMQLREYVPDYRMNLICARQIEHPENFKTCLQHIFHMLKYNSDKKRLYQYIEEYRTELKQMDQVETMAALILLGEQKRVEKLLAGDGESEGFDMYSALDELIKDGEKRGWREGKEEGRREGEKKGKREGERKGRRDGRREGKREGKREGENRMLLLVKALLNDNCPDLISKMEGDVELRERLYKKYRI